MTLPTTILLLSVDEAHRLAYSLPAAVVQEGAEVVVIDNACTDTTADLARAHGARLLRLPERCSYAAAVNAGIAATAGPAVLLLNADCYLAPDFLARARPRLEEDRVGSVAPKLLRDADGAIDGAGMTVDRRRKNGLVGHGRPAAAYPRAAEAFGADGAAALYRRSVLTACAIGDEVLDEDLGLWASDADLAWRARLLGWRCVYEPAARARHVRTYSPSTRATVAEAHRRLQFRNRYLMWVKNETRAGLLRDLPFVVAYEIAALGHVLLRERHLLRAYHDAWRALPGARRRRAEVQSRRAVRRVPFGLSPPAA
ncbi:MAG TPA: glycosyltransferase [Solirubrobacteraceae bacterium]|jgi:GT2 family glycosyltransferase